MSPAYAMWKSPLKHMDDNELNSITPGLKTPHPHKEFLWTLIRRNQPPFIHKIFQNSLWNNEIGCSKKGSVFNADKRGISPQIVVDPTLLLLCRKRRRLTKK